MVQGRSKLTEYMAPTSHYFAWKAFQHLARIYHIDFEFNKNGEVGFERENFMRLMDLYALTFNDIDVDSPLYVNGFRTRYLRPGTHLLNAFIIFEDRYTVESRFDDGGQVAWFKSDGITPLIMDLIYWNAYGGPMKIC